MENGEKIPSVCQGVELSDKKWWLWEKMLEGFVQGFCDVSMPLACAKAKP